MSSATVSEVYNSVVSSNNEENSRSASRASLKEEVDKLSNSILKDWRSSVSKAASNGAGKLNLLTYDTSQQGGRRTSFLMCGPRQIGLKFFTNQGVVPVYQQIINEIETHGFKVYHWYPGKNRNILEVVWLNPSSHRPYDFTNIIEASNSNPDYFDNKFDNMYSNFLLQTIRTTLNYRTEKISKSVLSSEEQTSLSNEVDEFYNKIVSGWDQKVRDAHKEGYTYVNLATYDGASDEGKRYSYLVNGPRNLRYKFYYRNGIEPLMVRLREYFEPHFSVSHKYFSRQDENGAPIGNVIELRWI